MSASLLIRGALLVDGTGSPPRNGDALVVDGRIAALGPPGSLEASGGLQEPGAVIDAGGLALAPGFIDLHAHSDLALLTDPEHLVKTTQGFTTEVLGQDGLSYAPVDARTRAVLREQLAGWNGLGEQLDWSWRSVADYLDRIDAARPAVNACYLVPQGTVRMLVLGSDDRPATAAELTAMSELVRQGLREGAVGLSSGLTYVPGMYAGTAELVALCRVVAEEGGFYAPHQRSYGRGALAAYQEMIEVSRRSGCALHLTHATMNFAENAGRAGELLAAIDAGIADGLDITLDSYPYLPGSTTLAALLPSWASAGGPDATLARLADPVARERIRHDLEVTGSDGCHGVPVEWSTLQISGVRHRELDDVVGRTLAELARTRRRPGFEVFVEVLRRDRLGTTILQHVGHEANVQQILRHPAQMIGTDGLLTGARPHPRAAGTVGRYLGHYVRELGLLGLADAVARLTSRPARRLGLTDRGVLRPGAVADLVLFDPQTVAAGADYDHPRRVSIGIPYVFVAGVAVIEHGHRTQARPGRSLRRPRSDL